MNDLLGNLTAGVKSNSLEETRSIASSIAPMLPSDTVLCLNGPIGSGKTSFAAALAASLGVKETVTSPSYNLLSIHKAGTKTILHLDAYRLDDQANEDAFALEDLMETPWLLVVEWAENVPELLPTRRWELFFEITGKNNRLIKLKAP